MSNETKTEVVEEVADAKTHYNTMPNLTKKERRKVYNKKYADRHKNKIKQIAKNYYENNATRLKQRRKERYAASKITNA